MLFWNSKCLLAVLLLLPPCSEVFLHKLRILQPVKEFPTFYETWGFITMFTTAPPLVSVLSQKNPDHILQLYLFEMYFDIIIPSVPRSFRWSLAFRFPHQNFVFSSASYVPHSLACLWLLDFIKPYNGWGAQIIELFIMQFSAVSHCCFLFLRSRYLFKHPVFEHSEPKLFYYCGLKVVVHLELLLVQHCNFALAAVSLSLSWNLLQHNKSCGREG